jgi:hypothetical protein
MLQQLDLVFALCPTNADEQSTYQNEYRYIIIAIWTEYRWYPHPLPYYRLHLLQHITCLSFFSY